MAGKVFFSVSMSLDGFVAPESMEGFIAPERRDDPDVQRWMAQWMELQPSEMSASPAAAQRSWST
jgi:hypothetical protein